ncbi:MAG: tRNA (guanosine(46)-N7)-methyltransferase TrmB [Nitrospinaceae bacterium]|nr:tRNA (guanosine(46)-N7)-methyltransferase TrmB [Nitrospinaceae bacterium]NIR53244.1 tRNA (guanosine(46)-N7)-methyltransferase TrmB [Nitrospinaceae bacterium]NIS83642.1 tRNA (guanosine(46)-N7)-methyltransferase TrmB [Nitrospinaceae bacterium]NIT80433.1 tRNA (guanosine(46)-N7)-methyltransferase TrmB [Nitrospinaceae bacterium]NIU42771.1 tRNA (guanosine(46)-N7)-methyltransferase TrmB [Nitrospinaceae bacterium]
MGKRLISFETLANGHPSFLDLEERPDWPGLFQNRNPLKLEIGFGNGNFLMEMAIREPQSNFIGLEFYHKGIRKLITRADRLHLKNIRVIYGNASEKVPLLFEEEELSEIYINFPDPWPKKRHHKRRLIKASFVETLAGKLAPGGKLRIATDFEAYAREILDLLEAENRFANCHEKAGFAHERPEIPKTKYEQNFLNAGKVIYYMDYSKEPDLVLTSTG